jgi:DNA (cytosine-5)-methyltransferase 1
VQPIPSSSDSASDEGEQHLATVLDLFSGAGGMTQGFHGSGAFRTVRAVEMDPQAAASFAATFGDVVHVGSISDWLANCDVPSVDVVVGGPPCQGFSTLGKQDAEDERNALWHDYALTIVRAQPRYFVLENVGAFLKSRQFADLRAATEPGGLLADYDFEAGVLNAADFGAAQARRRTILIGHHRDLPAPGLPQPTHVGRHVTVRGVLADVSPHVETTELPAGRWTVVGTREVPGAFATSELHVGRTYSELSMKRFRAIPENGNRFDIPEKLLSPCWVKHKAGSADVMGRLSWDKPSVTIRTEFFKPEKGRYLHPDEDRALTHLEAALIQGFPDSHRWVGSKTSIARQIGNAVPIPLGRAIAAHLSQAMTRATADDSIDLAAPIPV